MVPRLQHEPERRTSPPPYGWNDLQEKASTNLSSLSDLHGNFKSLISKVQSSSITEEELKDFQKLIEIFWDELKSKEKSEHNRSLRRFEFAREVQLSTSANRNPSIADRFNSNYILPSAPSCFKTNRMIRPVLRNLVIRAFLEFKCCQRGIFCKKSYKDYRILKVIASEVLQYSLKTVYERRCTKRSEKPYKGETETCNSSQPTSLWKIKADVAKPYNDKHIRIPGTSKVKPCSRCFGKGSTTCNRCKGTGRHTCRICNGEGHCNAFHSSTTYNYDTEETEKHQQQRRDACHQCFSHGTVKCEHCHGEAGEECKKCKTYGKVETFTEAVVSWYPRQENLFVGAPHLHEEFLKKCNGVKFLSEKGDYKSPLQPITAEDCASMSIINGSNKLLELHQFFDFKWKIRKQTQFLQVIPIYHIVYERQGKRKDAWVGGKQLRVYDS